MFNMREDTLALSELVAASSESRFMSGIVEKDVKSLAEAVPVVVPVVVLVPLEPELPQAVTNTIAQAKPIFLKRARIKPPKVFCC